ncbi:hypothetical protein [Pseudomonas brassicacearum]|uniref:hypothetical protein n=1 Tax=Pseudomonas brassicacearum TaxID=930166 RepID=UPI001D00347E|nr:hypothetical protein [Pseudomonas brassicacearum]
MPWYKTGTVSVTLNSNAVTGTGTAFIVNSRVGDAFRGPDGRWYEVTNVASNTAISIDPPYIGASASGGSYALAPMQGYVKDSADALRAIVNTYGAQLAALKTTGNYDILPVSKGGTGITDLSAFMQGMLNDPDAAAGRLTLSSAKSGANADITSLTGLTTPLSVAQGGTGRNVIDPWAFQPLGVPLPILFDTAGNTPPQNQTYKYIKLTASDAYNAGLLTSETVSGSAPLVEATAVISLAGSIFNGATVALINTDRSFIRAGSPRVKQNDALQNITGSFQQRRLTDGTAPMYSGVGALSVTNASGIAAARSTAGVGATLASDITTFDASAVVRTDTETRSKNIGATYYMRIL